MTETVIFCLIAPEGSFFVSATERSGDFICKIRLFQCFFFLDFTVSRKVPKTGVVFVAAAGG